MEVPARFVRDCLDGARECGLAPEELLSGLAFTRAQLDEPARRIRWNDLAELLDRIAAALGTNDRIEEHGRIVGVRIAPWAFAKLVKHVASPTLVLRIALQFVGPMLFPHLGHDFEVRADGTLRLALSVPPSYRGGEVFFRFCMGGIRASTTILGYGPPLIAVASIGPRGCVLDITPPPNRTAVGRIRSAFRALRGESALRSSSTATGWSSGPTGRFSPRSATPASTSCGASASSTSSTRRTGTPRRPRSRSCSGRPGQRRSGSGRPTERFAPSSSAHRRG